MDLVREFDSLAASGPLIDLVTKDESPWEPSHMYDRAAAESRVDPGLRRSSFKTLTSIEALDAAAALVQAVSEADDEYEFVLRRDDVTVLHYEDGGFFGAHSDYVTLTSNALEEFTLLLCLPTTDCVGGGTRFLLNPRFSAVSTAGVTPGHMVVFRKDIRHEALPVTSGIKEVVTLNLYGARRSDAGHALIRCVDGVIFSAPIDLLPKESVFTTLLADIGGGAKIVEIPIDESSAEFEVVHRAIMRCQICVDDCDFTLMKKYGIDPSGLLTPGPDIPASVIPKEGVMHIGHHGRVTLYSSYALAEYFYNKHHSSSEILFGAVICEGKHNVLGEFESPLGPDVYYMTVGHKRNIFVEKMLPNHDTDLPNPKDIDAADLLKCLREEEGLDVTDWVGGAESDIWPCFSSLCLEMCTEPDIAKAMIDKFTNPDKECVPSTPITDPLNPSDVDNGWVMMSVDDGDTYVCGEQAFRMYRRLHDLEAHRLVVEAVMKDMPHVAFPQTTDTYSAMLCNEQDFGNVSLVFVGGVIDVG